MKIPEVRKRLRTLSLQIEDYDYDMPAPVVLRAWSKEINLLVDQLYRRPMANTKNRRVSVPMCHEMVMAIREMRKSYPDMTQTEIAHRLNISAGRVSEVLRGKRR